MLAQTIVSFLVGLGIILAASQLFLKIAEPLATQLRFSPLFISLVVIALGTNLPEISLTISSLQQGDPGLAMGNILGSSILNITLILGLSLLFNSVRIGTHKTLYNALLLLGHTMLFIGLKFSAFGHFERAIILIISLLMTITVQYLMALNGRNHEDKKLLKSMKQLIKKKHPMPWYLSVFGLAASTVGLSFGGSITVSTIGQLSELLNISTTILGLTLTAIATSAPELILTTIAAFKKEDKVVVGTLLGSNIINLSLLPGIILLFSQPISLNPAEFIFLLFSTVSVVSLIFAYKGENVPRAAGLVLLGIAALFIYTTFALVW